MAEFPDDTNQFLENDSFIRWVLYHQNATYWQQYEQQNPEQQQAINQARQFIIQVNTHNQITSNYSEEEQLWQRIQNQIEGKPTPQKTPWLRATAWPWAAAVMLLVGTGYYAVNQYFIKKINYQTLVKELDQTEQWFETENSSDKPQKLLLADGSSVTLAQNSKIRYQKKFTGNTRKVILSGEALFDVAKNPDKPFYVYSNELVVRVLGTSFRVSAFEQDSKITVKVLSGRVSVYQQNEVNLYDPDKKALLLLPNQQIVYNRPSEELTKRLVEKPIAINTQLKLNFDDAPATEIMGALEQKFAVKIIYDPEKLQSCYLTTKLVEDNLYDQLDLLCALINAQYKELDAQIYIEAKGCK
jgi:transmembrane sensor